MGLVCDTPTQHREHCYQVYENTTMIWEVTVRTRSDERTDALTHAQALNQSFKLWQLCLAHRMRAQQKLLFTLGRNVT